VAEIASSAGRRFVRKHRNADYDKRNSPPKLLFVVVVPGGGSAIKEQHHIRSEQQEVNAAGQDVGSGQRERESAGSLITAS
jgi:hypothetical protein